MPYVLLHGQIVRITVVQAALQLAQTHQKTTRGHGPGELCIQTLAALRTLRRGGSECRLSNISEDSVKSQPNRV